MTSALTKPDLETLRSTTFFGSLPQSVFTEIVAHARVVDLSHGETLFREGEKATAVFAVLSGLVKLTVGESNGQEIVIELFHRGNSFAEALAFGNGTYPVSGNAITQSRVLVASNSVVQRAIGNDPDTFNAILAATFRHMHSLVRQIKELKGNSGQERVARYILARTGVEQSELEIPFEKQVLASVLGIKPESLSRAFRRLGEHGVAVSKNIITVSDPRALNTYLDRK